MPAGESEAAAGVSGEMIAALGERFAAGRPRRSYFAHGGLPPVVRTELHTMRLAGRRIVDLPIIATDGSVDEASGVSGCAAVAADGRALVGWYRAPSGIFGMSQYAELQAARLGLRLARGRAGIRLHVDGSRLAGMLQRLQAHHPADCSTDHRVEWSAGSVAFGVRDAEAIEEIASMLRAGEVYVDAVTPEPNPNRTHSHPLMVAAHSLAWTVRRLLCDRIDPMLARDHLIQVAERGGNRNKSGLKANYAWWRTHRPTAQAKPP